MAAPSLGDFIEGGYVYRIDTTNEIAYVASQKYFKSTIFSQFDLPENITTSSSLDSSPTNNTLLSSAEAVIYVTNNIEQSYSDWLLPSLQELFLIINLFSPILSASNSNSNNDTFGPDDLLNLGTSNAIFWCSSLKDNTPATGTVQTVDLTGNIGFEGYNVSADIIAIRSYSYTSALINLSDSDGTIINPQNSIINFGFVGSVDFVPTNPVEVIETQRINFNGNANLSQSFSFYIDFTKLAGNQSNLVSVIFADVSNLESVQTFNQAKIYYTNANLSSENTLTNLSNNEVYLANFFGNSRGNIRLNGVALDNTNVTVSSGESWVGVPSKAPLNLLDLNDFTLDMQAATLRIIDLNTGGFWPQSSINPRPLTSLIPGRGYYFRTTSSYVLNFPKT